MFPQIVLVFTLLISIGTSVIVADVDNGTNANQTESNDETQGRSSFLSDMPREGRIINDEKISIKGFIPIVGLSDESVKSSNNNNNNNNNNKAKNDQFMDMYLKNMASNNYNGPIDNGEFANLPQHVAQPEDQRRIGTALQGLLGNGLRRYNSASKPSITRKSDCVCVPFYMCKNGHLSEGAIPSNNDLSSMYSNMMYEQRRREMVEQNQYQQQQQQQPPTGVDEYLPINERSNDHNDTKIDDEMSRMVSGKSMSDGCGLLRICCAKSNPNAFVSNDMIGLGQEYNPMIPEMNPMYNPFKPIQPQYKPNIGGYFNPTIRPPPQRMSRPPKLIQSGGYMEPMIQLPLPVPIRNEPTYSSNVVSMAYDKCGSRQSVGINGRVQNLNYHQSSTEFGEFPWQVAILKKIGPSDNLYVCGGALISSGFVMTAAHCIKKFQAHDIKIRLGEWDVHREDEFYPYVERNVDEIVIHPQFSPRNLANDVALLRIDSEIDFNQYPHISSICLAESYDIFASHRCYVAGWGKNAFGRKGEYQSVLMKVDLPVLDSRNCENMLRRTKLGYGYRLHSSMICAGGEPGKDACEGDGGSGLVCEVNGSWKVAGLVSWGLGCGQASVPGVYTNVAQIRSWVDKVVFPYYANILHAKSSEKDFNELISERSVDGANSTITISNSTLV